MRVFLILMCCVVLLGTTSADVIYDGKSSGVSGPLSSTDGNIATFNGTDGATIQDSGSAVTEFATGTPVYAESDPTIVAGAVLPAMDGGALTGLTVSTSDYLALADGTGGTNVYNIAFGKYAYADSYSVSLGGKGTSTAFSVSIGYGAVGGSYGDAIGYGANASDHGVSIGTTADGNNYGVALGHNATGSGTNIAIGVSAVAAGQERISIGHSVSGEVDNTTTVRGTLYLDGGTGVVYRSTFGSGVWTALAGGGGATPQVKYISSADWWSVPGVGADTNTTIAIDVTSNGYCAVSEETDVLQSRVIHSRIIANSFTSIQWCVWSSVTNTGTNTASIVISDTAGNSYSTSSLVGLTGNGLNTYTMPTAEIPAAWSTMSDPTLLLFDATLYSYYTNNISFPAIKVFEK